MKTTLAALVMLTASACATQEAAAPFQMDSQGYFRLPIGDPSTGLDTTKIGEQMAQGEIYCQQRGQTAETGFVTGPNGAFVRFRCVDQAPAQ